MSRSSSSLNSWKTTPTLRRYMGILRCFIVPRSIPATEIFPDVGISSLSRSLMIVDFPDPLSPVMNTNSPLSISNDSLSTAGGAPLMYTSDTSRNSIRLIVNTLLINTQNLSCVLFISSSLIYWSNIQLILKIEASLKSVTSSPD